jgi:hypothetical protein
MPTADQVIAFFEAHDGLAEDPPGSNCTWISQWFWEQTDNNQALSPGCYSWCAVTVSRALNEAWGDPDVWQVPGISPDWRPGFSYVPSVRAAFVRAGRFHESGGQKGDLVIYDWDGDGWGDHIGVFVSDVDGETCLVWEGNTSSNDISLRRRPYSLIAGFCRPPYDTPEEDEMTQDERDTLNYAVAMGEEWKRWVGQFDPQGEGEYWRGQAALKLRIDRATPNVELSAEEIRQLAEHLEIRAKT